VSEFDDVLEEYLGDADALSDIRVVVRRLWFYDFDGYPNRLCDGQGKLFTSDDNQWLGTIDANGTNHHQVPRLQDGRDGSSPSYNFSVTLIDVPGQSSFELYEALKADQALSVGRSLTCYHAIFKIGEALRPTTPIAFFKELTMLAPKFSETIARRDDGVLARKYVASVVAKDGNTGRTSVPNGTYADSIQKQRAKERGVVLDRGSEYLAALANRTYQIP
jgi:hypothetical protein